MVEYTKKGLIAYLILCAGKCEQSSATLESSHRRHYYTLVKDSGSSDDHMAFETMIHFNCTDFLCIQV